ncbi:SSCRP protein [Trichoderma parareesei]|uniref:SSCRP protein n=3 Tax=Trichoderma TaxID=5543 RepID=A0A2H3A0C0_TRIPA|nr:SSCRP protein [Trichoderma parareesei]
MHFSTASVVLGLASLAAAQLPAVAIVQKIAPTATSCADSSECRTAEQAAPFIAKSMSDYGIYTTPEMAAIVSLMAFESVEFKYKHNVSPGRAGQGTANMQMAQFNLAYALSIPSLKAQVAQFTTVDGLADADLNKILALVQPDEFNFASGAWYYKTYCEKTVQAAFWANVDDGFTKYMQCVGAAVTDDRLTYWNRAKEAFGIN